jgi:hypothetical protein
MKGQKSYHHDRASRGATCSVDSEVWRTRLRWEFLRFSIKFLAKARKPLRSLHSTISLTPCRHLLVALVDGDPRFEFLIFEASLLLEDREVVESYPVQREIFQGIK